MYNKVVAPFGIYKIVWAVPGAFKEIGNKVFMKLL